MPIKLEIKKQLLLADCEKTHLFSLLMVFSGKCTIEINKLEDIITLDRYYIEKLEQYQHDYKQLTCQFSYNKNKELAELNERISNAREGMNVLQLALMKELTPLLEKSVSSKKKQIKSALESAYEYKNNLKILHEIQALEDYPNLEADYKEYVEHSKNLNEAYTYLINPVFNFTDPFIAAQNHAINQMRFLNHDSRVGSDPTKIIDKHITTYKAELLSLRQRIISTSSVLLFQNDYIDMASIAMLRLAARSHPDAVKPAERKMPFENNRRVADLPAATYEQIRAERYKYSSQEKLMENWQLEENIRKRRQPSLFYTDKKEPGGISEPEKIKPALSQNRL